MKSTRRRLLGFPAGVISTVTGASGSSGRSTCHDFGTSPARTVVMLPFLFLAGVFVVMPLLYHGAAAACKSPALSATVRRHRFIPGRAKVNIPRLMSDGTH